MKTFLNKIRTPHKAAKPLFSVLLMLAFGLFLGLASRLLDIYTSNLGNVFSQMSIWILLCVIIAAKSENPLAASLRVLAFCLGMLFTYYLAAHYTDGIYSKTFIIGWSIFALISVIPAYFSWYAVGQGAFARLLDCGIIAFLLLCAVVMFDKIRFADIAIAAALILFLYIETKRRTV